MEAEVEITPMPVVCDHHPHPHTAAAAPAAVDESWRGIDLDEEQQQQQQQLEGWPFFPPGRSPAGRPQAEWCENTERIAVAWNDIAQINHKFCIRARAFYGNCMAACSFPVALGGSLLATLVTVMQQDPPVLPRRAARAGMYALAFLGLFMTLLRVAQAVFRLDERYAAFDAAVKGWEKFATRCTFELAKRREFRISARVYFASLGRELEDLQQQTPVVPGFIVRSVVQRYRRNPRERAKFDAMFKPFAYRTVFSTAKLMRAFGGAAPPTPPDCGYSPEYGARTEERRRKASRATTSPQTPQAMNNDDLSSGFGGTFTPTLLEEGGGTGEGTRRGGAAGELFSFLSIYGMKEEEEGEEGDGEETREGDRADAGYMSWAWWRRN